MRCKMPAVTGVKVFAPILSVHRPLIVSVIVTPFVVLLTGALHEQQADNLLPAIISTDHMTWFYWGLQRTGNVGPLLALPIQDIRLNLIVQICLRVGSLLFVLFWLAQTVAAIMKCSPLWTYLATAIFSSWWITSYTDGADSLVYGASPHVTSFAFAICAVAVVTPTRMFKPRRTILEFLLLPLPLALWLTATWGSLLVVMFAPALLVLSVVAYSQETRTRVNKYVLLWWIGIQLFFVAISGAIWGYVAVVGGENSKFSPGVITAIRYHSYIWNNLRLAVVLIVVAVLLTRRIRGTVVLLAAVLSLGTLIPIAAAAHVSTNFYMPRYFGVTLILGVLLPMLVIVSRVVELLHLADIPNLWTVSRRAIWSSLIVASVVGAILVTPQKIGYGTGRSNAIGFDTSTTAMSADELTELESDLGTKFRFVNGNYWRVWPTVFEMRSSGIEILGVTLRAQYQRRFSQLYSGETIRGLCLGEIDICQLVATDADYKIFLEPQVDNLPVTFLQDGTPVRLMTLKAP